MSSPRHMARGAWYGLLTQAVDKFLPVAIILYLARSLEPEQFGLYAFLVAYLAFFQIAAEQSLDTVLVRMMSQAPGRRVAILHAGLGLRILVALLAAATATLLAGPISGWRVPVGLVVLASLGLLTGMAGAYRAYYRADLDIRVVLWIAVARAVLLATAVVTAMLVWPGLYALFAAVALANLLAFAAIALAASRGVPLRIRVDPALWRSLLSGALPVAANAFAMTVTLRAGQVILLSLRGAVEVGLLGAASRVTEAFTLLPEALMISVYPLMAGLHKSNDTRLLLTASRSARYLVTATGVPVILCALGGSEIMTVLFGKAFAEAGPVLSLLGLMALLSATGTVALNLLVAVHREKQLSRNTLVFSAVNVALCFPLITRYGYPGAAIAMVATSAASQLSLALLPATGHFVRPCLLAGLRPLLAVACAVVTGSALAHDPLVACAIGLGAYALALLGLGVLNREELGVVRTMLAAFSSDEVEDGDGE